MKPVACWFLLREAFTLIFLQVILILSIEHPACWLLFMELFECWLLFMKLVLYYNFSAKIMNWLYFSQKWFCSGSLLRADVLFMHLLHFDFFFFVKLSFFMKLVAWWFCPCNLIRFAFFSKKSLYVDISIHETCALIFLIMKLVLSKELVVCWLLLVKHVCCWFFGCWFSHRENGLVHKTCRILVFIREIYSILVFLLVKFEYWFFFSWNFDSSCNLLCADFVRGA